VDTDGSLVAPIAAYNNEQDRENVFNQTDLVFSLETGAVKHELLAGVELGKQKTDNFRQTGFFNNDDELTEVTVPVSDPTISIPVAFRQDADDNDNHIEADIVAVYLQDQLELSEHWQAVLGVRYDNFDVDFRNNRTGEQLSSDDDLVRRARGSSTPIEPVSLYASYSMTYLPRSGAQMTSLTASNEALDPEEYENYEIGAKWDLRPDLSLSAAVYRLDRTNVAIPIRWIRRCRSRPTVPDRGIELGCRPLTEAWSVFGGYAYQDGELTATARRPPDGATPRSCLSTRSHLESLPVHARLGVGLGLICQSEMFTSTDNTVTLLSFTRVDAAVFYSLNDRISTATWRTCSTDYFAYGAQQQQHHAGLAAGRAGRRTVISEIGPGCRDAADRPSPARRPCFSGRRRARRRSI
jgi:catecholate siderophore receptor